MKKYIKNCKKTIRKQLISSNKSKVTSNKSKVNSSQKKKAKIIKNSFYKNNQKGGKTVDHKPAPYFYEFNRSLYPYVATLDNKDSSVVEPNSDFFKYFKNR